MSDLPSDPEMGRDALHCVFQWDAVQDDFRLVAAAPSEEEAQILAATQQARDPEKSKCVVRPLTLIWEVEET